MNRRRGTAFIIVLWLIVVLGALVASFSIVAVHSANMVASTQNIGSTQEIANAGAEAWMGKVREHAVAEEEGVLLTEVLPYEPYTSLTIVEVGINPNSPRWFIVHNPTEQPLTYCGFSMNNGSSSASPTTINPNEYLYVCDGSSANCDNNFAVRDDVQTNYGPSISDSTNPGGLLIAQNEDPHEPDVERGCPTGAGGLADQAVDRVSWMEDDLGTGSDPDPDYYWTAPVQVGFDEMDSVGFLLERRVCSDHPEDPGLTNCSGNAPLQTFRSYFDHTGYDGNPICTHPPNDPDEIESCPPGQLQPAPYGAYCDHHNFDLENCPTGQVEVNPPEDHEPEANYSSYSGSAHEFPMLNNFLELHNTRSESVDVVNLDYLVSGETSQNHGDIDYELVAHPGVNQTSTVLQADMTAVIAHPEADFEKMGILNRLQNENVLALSLRNTDPPDPEPNPDPGEGFPGFLPMNTQQMETLTFERPEGDFEDLEPVTAWEPPAITPSETRELVDSRSPENGEEWVGLPDGGTPGEWEYTFGVDWYGAPYGWLNEFSTGASLTDQVYVPSFENTRQENDIGYFRFVRIEDESGKMDLLRPHTEGIFSPPEATTRHAMTSSESSEAYDLAQENWMTPGDLLQVEPGWDDEIYRGTYRSTLYSPYREPRGANQTGLINLNMASYEALASVPRSIDGGDTEYLTGSMIETLIEARSADDPDELTTVDDGVYPELSTEAFPENQDATPFTSTQDACELLKDSTTNDLDCGLFSEYTTVVSDGLFTLEVIGVRTNSRGEEVARARKRITVDSRDLRNESGALEVIYSRFLTEDLPDHQE